MTRKERTKVTLLAGGVGAARLLRGLVSLVDPDSLTVVVNTGDDEDFYGLHVSPDLDTIVYTLAGLSPRDRGWSMRGDTHRVLGALERFYGPGWFALGDRDIATHVFRIDRLRAGATLSECTQEICAALGVRVRVVPGDASRGHGRPAPIFDGKNERALPDGCVPGRGGRVHPLPITPRIFQAKVKAWLRRTSSLPMALLNEIAVGGVRLDPGQRLLHRPEREPARLTALETRLLVLLMSSFGAAFVAPWDNPNGYWIYDVSCEDGTYDVWVPNDNTVASFKDTGGVGVMKALYMDFGSGYELIWQVPGKGVFKHTTWCEWVIEGLPPMAGKVLIP